MNKVLFYNRGNNLLKPIFNETKLKIVSQFTILEIIIIFEEIFLGLCIVATENNHFQRVVFVFFLQ